MEPSLFPIIETKLIPPIMKRNYIRRPSLMKKLNLSLTYPLTLVHSGAGYGKSTAITQYVNDFRKNYCWYTLTPNDDDIIPFITYIVYAIRKRYQDFGKDLLTYISNMNKVIRDQELNILSAYFIRELSSLKDETILVIDDFHLVDHSFMINQWLEKVIELLPLNFHLLISSRRSPKWSLLSKWKVSGKLLLIDQRALKLSEEETEILIHDFYELKLSHKEITSIYRLTEGWVIALRLIAEQLQRGTSLSSIFDYQHSSMDDLFHYLAMEVLAKHSPIIQSFIDQISVIEDITPSVCDSVLGMTGSEAILEQLCEQNSFIDKIDGTKQYRLHALFKAALQKRFKENNPYLFQQTHEKCAQYYVYQGQIEQALNHYEVIQNHEVTARLLSDYAPSMIKNGRLESLNEHLKNLSEEIKNEYPILWYYEGEVQRYTAYYEKARSCYQHLIDSKGEIKDQSLIGRAYLGLAQIYIDTIQPVIAERYLLSAIEIFEQQNETNEEEIRHLYLLMVENLINSGQAKKAEKWIKKGKFNLSPLPINNLDARMLLRTGKLQDARDLLIKRLGEGHQALPQTHRETEILLSFIESCLGNGQDAKRWAQKGIEQGIKNKNLFVEACGWMRMGHSVQLIDDYQLHLAEECYQTSLDIMEKIHVSRGKAEPYMGLCILYSRLGNYEDSKKCGQLALYETEKVQDLWLSSLIQLALAITSYQFGALEEAKSQLIKVKQNFEQLKDPYGNMLSHLWLSLIFYYDEDWDSFKTNMSTFLQEMIIGNYEFILTKKTPFGPEDLQSLIPILIRAKEMGIYSSYVYSFLQKSGLAELDSHPGYTLKVFTLGNFQVYLGNQLVSEKDWQRQKAKELFKFLILNRNQWFTKEEIYERLWPEVDELSIDQEFKVILNTCNKVLEPKRKARTTPFYILRENNQYRINPKASIEIDFELFEHWIQSGLREREPDKAKTLILKGLDYYKGDLNILRQDMNSSILRDHYQNLFLRGAEKLAQLHVQLSEINEAIYWCEKIISVDRTWEEAYRLLMYCHYHKNNRAQGIKYYQQIRKILLAEFGVEPMEATTQMYQMIVESEL